MTQNLKKNFFQISALFLLVLIVSIYYKSHSYENEKSNNIIFGWPGTTFVDYGNDVSASGGNINIQGSLAGQNLEKLLGTGTIKERTNNKVMISCTHSKMECITYIMTQIGENITSDLPIPWTLPIVSWGKDLVVASDFDPHDTFPCSKVTLNINRKSQTTEWVQEPNNQDKTWCKDSYGSTYKWTISKPPEHL
jgi:hypothetical protein